MKASKLLLQLALTFPNVFHAERSERGTHRRDELSLDSTATERLQQMFHESREAICGQVVEDRCQVVFGKQPGDFVATETVRKWLAARESHTWRFLNEFFSFPENTWTEDNHKLWNTHHSGYQVYNVTCKDLCINAAKYARTKNYDLPERKGQACVVQNGVVNCNLQIDNWKQFLVEDHGQSDVSLAKKSNWTTLDPNNYDVQEEENIQTTSPCQDANDAGSNEPSEDGLKIPDDPIYRILDTAGTLDYSNEEYVLRILNLFLIFPAKPEAEDGASGSLVERGRSGDRRSVSWYNQVDLVAKKAQIYVQHVKDKLFDVTNHDLLKTWFGKDMRTNAVYRNRVTAVYADLMNKFGKMEWHFEGPRCKPRTFAYVFPQGLECSQSDLDDPNKACRTVRVAGEERFVINLCQLWENANEGLRIGTIIHEASHHKQARTHDMCLEPKGYNSHNGCKHAGYGRGVCQQLAKGGTENAVQNADNFEYFAVDLGVANFKCPSATQMNRVKSEDVDSDGDCQCQKDYVCYQDGSEGCVYSRDGKSEEYFWHTCEDCKCQPKVTTTTTTLKRCPEWRKALKKYPDRDGNCKCKSGYKCIEDVGENGETKFEDGCQIQGSRKASRKRYSADCDTCQCIRKPKDKSCENRDHVESESAQNGDCQCASGYRCYTPRRGLWKQRCKMENNQEDPKKFSSKCLQCTCMKPKQARVQNDDLQQQDTTCDPHQYCNTISAHDRRRLEPCETASGADSLREHKTVGDKFQCYNLATTCPANSESSAPANGNCKCKRGQLCHTLTEDGSWEQGCISTNSGNDRKFFLAGGYNNFFQCMDPEGETCPQPLPGQAPRNSEFPNEDGECTCLKGFRCWFQKKLDGDLKGKALECPTAGKGWQAARFLAKCGRDGNCECIKPTEEPTCKNKGPVAIGTPDSSGDCECSKGSICVDSDNLRPTHRVNKKRCKVANNYYPLGLQFFSATCATCKCVEKQCPDEKPVLEGGDCMCPKDTECVKEDNFNGNDSTDEDEIDLTETDSSSDSGSRSDSDESVSDFGSPDLCPSSEDRDPEKRRFRYLAKDYIKCVPKNQNQEAANENIQAVDANEGNSHAAAAAEYNPCGPDHASHQWLTNVFDLNDKSLDQQCKAALVGGRGRKRVNAAFSCFQKSPGSSVCKCKGDQKIDGPGDCRFVNSRHYDPIRHVQKGMRCCCVAR